MTWLILRRKRRKRGRPLQIHNRYETLCLILCLLPTYTDNDHYPLWTENGFGGVNVNTMPSII